MPNGERSFQNEKPAGKGKLEARIVVDGMTLASGEIPDTYLDVKDYRQVSVRFKAEHPAVSNNVRVDFIWQPGEARDPDGKPYTPDAV